MNWNILVIKGKDIKRDYISSGERKYIIHFNNKKNKKKGNNPV